MEHTNFNSEPPLAEALDRLLAGVASPEEMARLVAEYGEPRIDALKAAHTTYETANRMADPPTPYEHVRSALLDRVHQAEAIPSSRNRRIRGLERRLPTVKSGVLASLAAMAAAVMFAIYGMPDGRFSAANELASQSQYVTAAGQYAQVTIRNGVTAYLQPATALETTHGADGTTVAVNGQAVFEVSHSSSMPFTVMTGNAAVQVLGTTFSVRQYARDSVSTVTVSEGRVTVRSLGEPPGGAQVVTLEHGMRASVGVRRAVSVEDDAAPFDRERWRNGELVYRSTPVRDIVADLEHAYGIKIVLADTTLGAEKLTWTVHVRRHSLGDVIEELAEMLRARTTRQADTVTFVRGIAARTKNPFPIKTLTAENRYE